MNGSSFILVIDKRHVRFHFITIGVPAYKYTSAFEICLCENHHFVMGIRSNLPSEKSAQIVTLCEVVFSEDRIAAIKLLSVVSVK